MPELKAGHKTKLVVVGNTVQIDVEESGLKASELDEPTTATLTAWANSGAYTVDSYVKDEHETVETAQITWPDGSAGTLTVTQVVDYSPSQVQLTHVASGSTITITAPEEA